MYIRYEPVEIQVLSDGKITTTLMSLLVVLLQHCKYCVMLYVTCHNCSHDQDSKAEVEGISGEDKVSITTFIVSSSQASPEYDMCVSVNINGGQTPHTVTIKRKASRKCICQVFYQREEVNCWKTTFAFCPEYLLDVS